VDDFAVGYVVEVDEMILESRDEPAQGRMREVEVFMEGAVVPAMFAVVYDDGDDGT
jgi:hypothetical protein